MSDQSTISRGDSPENDHLYIAIRTGQVRVTRKSPGELRFWKKIDKDGPLHPVLQTRCWFWEGYKAKDGYGSIYAEGKAWRTHRFSWHLNCGAIPEDMQVLHHCDMPLCCNPAHLFLGTNQDNMDDMAAKGRRVPVRGERHGFAKLTEEQVREIRHRYRRWSYHGSNCLELAEEYGVWGKTIRDIARGKKWKHVERNHDPNEDKRHG